MVRILFGIILAVEIFALTNRGGGPLLSHLALTGATFVILLCVIIFKNRLQFEFRPRFFLISYALFSIFFVASFFTSLTPEFGLSELLLFVNAGILLFVFSGVKFTEKDLDSFSIILIAVAVIDALIGYFIYTNNAFPRFAGTFLDLAAPYTAFGNDYANFLLIILPLALSRLFKKNERLTTTIVTVISCAILISGFTLSFSRGAWVSGFAVLLCFFIWIFIKRKRCADESVGFSAGNPHERTDVLVQRYISTPKLFIRIGAAIFLTILLITGLQSVRSQKYETVSLFKKATFTADEGGASSSERIQFWRGALKLIKDHPLLGSGAQSFKYLYPRYQEKFGITWDHPHNIFLKIGVENGVIAMIFFALFIIGAAIAAIKFLWSNPWHPILPFLFGSLGAFGHNLIDYNFIVANFTLFIVFLGASLSFTQHKTAISAGSKKIQLAVISIITLVSIASVGLGLYEGFYNADFKKGRSLLASNELDLAIIKLERAGNLVFERDRVNYLALAYRKKYETTKDIAWLEKEKKLLEDRSKWPPPVDAAAIGRLGEIYLEQKNPREAFSQFAAAIKLDPMNRFKYYYFYFDTGHKAKVKNFDDGRIETRVLALLEEYKTALAENRHMTILTDNPTYASKLYEFFNRKEDAEEINNIWFQEYIKFSIKYGAPSVTIF